MYNFQIFRQQADVFRRIIEAFGKPQWSFYRAEKPAEHEYSTKPLEA